MSWSHYLFGFGGRINRAKMWAYLLIVMVAEIPLIAIGTALSAHDVSEIVRRPLSSPTGLAFNGLFGLAVILVAWSMLAVAAKRFHDRDKSAWWLLFFYSFPVAISFALWAWGETPEDGTVPPAFILALAAIAANNLWYFAELFVLKGTAGPNRFGPDPLHSL